MVLAGFHGKYVNWLKPFFIDLASRCAAHRRFKSSGSSLSGPARIAIASSRVRTGSAAVVLDSVEGHSVEEVWVEVAVLIEKSPL